MSSRSTALEGTPRPRYGRITAFAAALLTTLVSVGGTVLPTGAPTAAGSEISEVSTSQEAALTAADLRASPPAISAPPSREQPSPGITAQVAPAPPDQSGTGRRVVFDQSDQRVWLVGRRDRVRRTYPVSGSVYDNLPAGSYQVYSRSRHATGIDGSALDFMVRFANGPNAAIGFHAIPVLDGRPMQTRDQLGTALSHGCVRQDRPDARALWRFAPVGTPVVVTA